MNKISLGLALVLATMVSVTADAKHKGFVLKSDDGNYKLKINGRVQARYTYEALEGFSEGEDDETSFNIPRARLKLSGHLFDKSVLYYFQTDFGKGNAGLKDFYTDYVIDKKWLRIRAGQWKRPFSRQQLTSSGKQELVDRAITDKAFLAGRDIGVALHNNYTKSPTVEYALGIFNGFGTKKDNVQDRLNPTLVARLGYNYGGIKGYSEADFEGGGFRFAIGASALMNLDFDTDSDGKASVKDTCSSVAGTVCADPHAHVSNGNDNSVTEEDSALMAEVDLMVKFEGLTLSGAFYHSQADGESYVAGKQVSDAMGFHTQLGYLLAGKYQPVVRYAMVKYDEADKTATELGAGFSIYPYKHKFKWQTDFAVRTAESDGSDKQTDYIIRTQLQTIF